MITGQPGMVPGDIERALAVLAPRRFAEVERRRVGDVARIEGIVVDAEA